MSNDLNKHTCIGHVGKDPVLSTMPNGKIVTNFSLATTSQWIDAIAVFCNNLETLETIAGKVESDYYRIVSPQGDIVIEHINPDAVTAGFEAILQPLN
mgnify:CR=1 FL=1